MQNVKSARQRWEERVGAPRVPSHPILFPDDAVAVIHKPVATHGGSELGEIAINNATGAA